MKKEAHDSFRFTQKAQKAIDETSLSASQDPVYTIYKTLKSDNYFSVPFRDYLKRYLYETKKIPTPPEDMSPEEYEIAYIVEEFKRTNTRGSLNPEAKTRIRGVVSKILTKDPPEIPDRETVLLLGLGLGMSSAEVNAFLVKALREYGLHPKAPKEVICWYCYEMVNETERYDTYIRLYKAYKALKPGPGFDSSKTISLLVSMRSIQNEEMLLDYLARWKANETESVLGMSIRNHYSDLYSRAKLFVAQELNLIENRRIRALAAAYCDEHENLLDSERKQYIDTRIRNKQKHYYAEEINPCNIETIFCADVPKKMVLKKKTVTTQDNVQEEIKLAKETSDYIQTGRSTLAAQFNNRRFDRQRIYRLLKDPSSINRFDLVTLNFYIISKTSTKKGFERKEEFKESTNTILRECLLGELNVNNPYEAFLLLCSMTDSPFETYRNVIGLSYPHYVSPYKKKRSGTKKGNTGRVRKETSHG